MANASYWHQAAFWQPRRIALKSQTPRITINPTKADERTGVSHPAISPNNPLQLFRDSPVDTNADLTSKQATK